MKKSSYAARALSAPERLSTPQLQMRKCCNGLIQSNAWVIEYLLEFRDRRGSLARGQVRLPANVNGIKVKEPNVEFSWQVTGIRQDAWANAHHIPAEVPKADRDRELYLHPELFGAPAEKNIGLAHHPMVQKLLKESAGK